MREATQYTVNLATGKLHINTIYGDTVQGQVRFGTKFVSVLTLYFWSDGFDKNQGSRTDVIQWILFVMSIGAPPGRIFDTKYSYIIGCQVKYPGKHKDAVPVDPDVGYRELERQVREFNSDNGKSFRVKALDDLWVAFKAHVGQSIGDTPERCGMIGLALSQASKIHKLLKRACDLAAFICERLLRALDRWIASVKLRANAADGWGLGSSPDPIYIMHLAHFLERKTLKRSKITSSEWKARVFHLMNKNYSCALSTYFKAEDDVGDAAFDQSSYILEECQTLEEHLVESNFNIDDPSFCRHIRHITGKHLMTTVREMVAEHIVTGNSRLSAEDDCRLQFEGMSGASVQKVKNIVIAGIQDPTLMDDDKFLQKSLPVHWWSTIMTLSTVNQPGMHGTDEVSTIFIVLF